jgi:hypothetical protein
MASRLRNAGLVKTPLLLVVLVGCTNAPVDLAHAGKANLSIETQPNTDGTFQLFAAMDEVDRCVTLDVDATFNGGPFDSVELGHHIDGRGDNPDGTCAVPSFTMSHIARGAGTIVISDASATITVDLPELAGPTIASADPLATIHANDTLRFGPALATGDTISFAQISATTPGALVVAANGDYCGDPMFQGPLAASGTDFVFDVPDVFAQWSGGACNFVLTKGTPVPADIDLELAAFLAGASCTGLSPCPTAGLDAHESVHANYVP